MKHIDGYEPVQADEVNNEDDLESQV